MNDLFHSEAAQSRPFLHADKVLDNFSGGARFSRKTWGLLSLELWHRIYHDRAHEYRGMLDDEKFLTEEQLTT